MKKSLLFCSLLLSASLAHGQMYSQSPFSKEYGEWIQKANALYEAHDYQKSGEAFSKAFGSQGDKGAVSDRYNAACVWALAGKKDSAFFQLNRIANARYSSYNHMIIDPDLDGLSVLRQLRSNRIEAHVLIVSAHDRAEDRIAGLDCGADDYVVKPFVHAELLARVRALVRRRHDTKPHVLRTGALEINTATRLVHYHGMQVNLSVREYSILEFLALRAGKVVSRRELWDHLSAFGHERTSNVIDVYIRFLRRKLDKPEMPSLIQTRRSQGYILVAERAGDLSHPVM